MCKWYKEMPCYIIVQDQNKHKFNLDKIAQRALLEQSFRNYAAVFDKVKIVINNSQKREYFLNFPFLCQPKVTNIKQKLNLYFNDSKSDTIFIGHANVDKFPIMILANLLRAYKNEMFMGYKSSNQNIEKLQFGIYHKSLIANSKDTLDFNLASTHQNSYRLLPAPQSTEQFR